MSARPATRRSRLNVLNYALFLLSLPAWYHLGMDFVGPISPPSRTGNRYILTISDYFTKFAWAKALPTKEAVNVAQALREVIQNVHAYTYNVTRSYTTVLKTPSSYL